MSWFLGSYSFIPVAILIMYASFVCFLLSASKWHYTVDIVAAIVISSLSFLLVHAWPRDINWIARFVNMSK
jgi:hypothetical protein